MLLEKDLKRNNNYLTTMPKFPEINLPVFSCKFKKIQNLKANLSI